MSGAGDAAGLAVISALWSGCTCVRAAWACCAVLPVSLPVSLSLPLVSLGCFFGDQLVATPVATYNHIIISLPPHTGAGICQLVL